MTELLLTSATLLGLLAFFEPCTIATHTLFAVRTHRSPDRCCENLLGLWFSRSLLLAGLLAGLTALSSPPAWGAFLPSIILTVIGVVYLVSRFAYLPVPHLDFARLIPGHNRLPESIRLGLTLPACTLPLFVVVAALAITRDSVTLAALAGLLFASLFTLPVLVAARRGIHEDGRDLLQRAARGSPYLTAVLLFGAAIWLLAPSLNIDTGTLKRALSEASWAGVGIAFLAGFIFSFNPVSFASIPVVLAYVTKSHDEKRAVQMGGAFVTGMIVTHVVLGVAAALGGGWVSRVMGREWGLFLGPLLILLGLMWPGWLKIRLPWLSMRAKKVTGIWGAFLLGIPFSVAVCPFCTPALLVTLTASAAVGSVAFGFALLLAFALGRSIPILLGAWSMGWLESLRGLARHQRRLEVIAGIVLILTGLYLLNEYFFFIKY